MNKKTSENRKKGLPFGRVIKLGVGSVKSKPIRFTITVVLFFACLSVVGWLCSVLYCDVPTAALRAYETYGSDEIYLTRVLNRDSKLEYEDVNVNFDQTDVKTVEDSFPDNTFDKIYARSIGNLGFQNVDTIKYYDNSVLNGCVVADASFLNRYGMKLVDGILPKNETEIAIPKYFFELYHYYEYRDSSGRRIPIDTFEDLAKLRIKILDVYGRQTTISIVGVVDTGFRAEDFEILKQKKANVPAEDWDDFKIASDRFDVYMNQGFHKAAFVTPEFIERFVNGFEVGARVLDETGILAYAYRGRAVSFSEAAAKKDFVRVLEGEGLQSGQCFAPLGYFIERRFMDEELLVERIRAGFDLSIKVGSDTIRSFRVVGYYKDGFQDEFVIADSDYAGARKEETSNRTIAALTTKLSDDGKENKKLLSFGMSAFDRDYNYNLGGFAGNAAMQMKSVKTATSEYIPLFGTAALVFSALMMFNFISATIAAKKKEIGVLKAIGTKNNAVFGIFAAESIFTAFIAFLASIVGSLLFVYFFNAATDFIGGYVWFLTYGAAEAVTVLLVGSAIALLGSLIPIVKLLRKKPMEILR